MILRFLRIVPDVWEDNFSELNRQPIIFTYCFVINQRQNLLNCYKPSFISFPTGVPVSAADAPNPPWPVHDRREATGEHRGQQIY